MPCGGHHQLLGAHVRGIDQMLEWGQACLGQRFVDCAGANGFVHVGRRGVRVDDQSRQIGIAGLRQVDHVPGPVGSGLGPEPGVDVVGRLDTVARTTPARVAQSHRAGLAVRAAPPLEVTRPHPPKDSDSGQGRGRWRRIRVVQGAEQAIAISSDLKDVSLAFRAGLRQASFLDR